jgi:DNA mismatch endonuclease (patch repair protein)
MSRIRSHDTGPEKVVRQLLTAMGLRYRLQRRDLPGRPDVVMVSRRTVVFVHGCFWHRHRGCREATTPTGNRDYWETKFETNVARDARNVRALRKAGWRVLTVWECETRRRDKLAARLQRLVPPV